MLGLLIVGTARGEGRQPQDGVDVAQVLKLPVIAVVPSVLPPEERRQITRRRWIVSGAAAALTVAAGYTVWTLRLWQFVA